jgi:hypothetical protein
MTEAAVVGAQATMRPPCARLDTRAAGSDPQYKAYQKAVKGGNYIVDLRK